MSVRTATFSPPERAWRNDVARWPTPVRPQITAQMVAAAEPPGTVPMRRRGRMSGWSQTANLSTVSDVARLQAAIRAAERGVTTQLFTLYRDFIAAGGHLGSELAKRKMALCAEPLSIVPSRKGNNADQRAADTVRKVIDNCESWERDELSLLDSCFYPLSVGEKIFHPVNDFSGDVPIRWGLKQIARVDPLLFCFQIPYVATGGSGAIQSIQAPGGLAPSIPVNGNPDSQYDVDDWEPDLRFWNTLPNGYIDYTWGNVYRPDPSRHLIHRGNFMVMPDNFGGPGRGCLFWAFFAAQGRDWFSRAVEYFGMPVPMVKADLENVDVLEKLQEMFSQAYKLRAFFLNIGTEAEWKEARTEQMAQAYSSYIHLCHDEISKSIIGQSLSSHPQSTGQGSGQAKLANDVRDDIRRFDHIMAGQTLRRGLFRQIMDYNGVTNAEPPRAHWGGATEADVKLLGQALQQLTQAQIEPTDDALEEIGERMGFRIQRISPEKIAMMGPYGDKATIDAPPAKKKNGEPNKSKSKPGADK